MATYCSTQDGGLQEVDPNLIGSFPVDKPQKTNVKNRLMITQMVLENFKSYAGVQRVGPFHKCFSSVVGPNGSGKSNVIDALLFVFGKRAKQLRLSKVSELIHNSTNHQDLTEARVSVYFQEILDVDDENFTVIKDSEFVVTRVAYRNNTSKYFIDEKSSTFTEVTSLLKGKGVDLDNNRFLILQGEVEQIAMMKPKGQSPHEDGLLEYLEDIIGTNSYITEIDDGVKGLEELNEKRMGMIQRLRVVEKDKMSLEGFKKEAERFLLTEASKLKWQRKLFEVSLQDSEFSTEEVDKKIVGIQEKLETERKKCSEFKVELSAMEGKHQQVNKEHEVIKTEMIKCQDEFKEFERKDVKFREDLKHSKSKLKKLEEKKSKDNQKMEECKKDIEKSEITAPKLEAQLDHLTVEVTRHEKVLEAMQDAVKDEVEKYQLKLSEVRMELAPYEKQLSEAKGQLNVNNSERDMLTASHEAARKQYAEAKSTLSTFEPSMADKETQVQETSDALQQANSQADKLGAEETALAAMESELESSVLAARGKVADLSDALSSEKAQNSVVLALMKAKQAGKLPGIFGRLGDLGAIDARYDIAISTACGALDYIVVDKASTAESCIEFLRDNNLGVATFLILEKQQHLVSAMKETVHTPENVPRLFDLVKPAEKALLPAFYFALRNTVVAKDLGQGNRIAYGPDRKFRRVVTLDGALFESSGTMAGGGGKPRGGKMGSSVRASVASKETVEAAEKELAQLLQSLEQVTQRRAAVVEELKCVGKQISEMQAKSPKLKLEIEALKSQKVELIGRMAGLEKAAIPATQEVARIKELETVISEWGSKLAEIQKSCAHLQKQVEDLQSSIENAGGEKVKKQKASIAAMQAEMDKISTDLNKLKVTAASKEKMVKKIEAGMEETERELLSQQNALEEMKEGWKQIEKEAFAVHDSYERVKKVLEAKQAELESIQKQHNDMKSAVKEMMSFEVDAQFQLDELRRQQKTIADKRKQFSHGLEAVDKEQHKLLSQLESDGVDSAIIQECSAPLAGQQRHAECEKKIRSLEEELKEMNPNMAVIAEYRKKESDFNERSRDLETATAERDAKRTTVDSLRKKRLDEFMAGFSVIAIRLKEMYQMITMGGDAELELVDSLDPFSEGIVFSVRPPKKSWKNINNLSGGEKTLSSLALVFALHHYKPTPLYVMDEIDAALDFKNVSIVAHYIKDRTKNAQFIIISLRNNMFELADRLVGIYKTDNCTKSVTINPRSFAVARG